MLMQKRDEMYAAEIWYTDAVLLMMDMLHDHSDTLSVSHPCPSPAGTGEQLSSCLEVSSAAPSLGLLHC